MRWSGLVTAGRALGAALLLLGLFTAAFHTHTDATGERGCVVCALARSSADTPRVVAVPAARVLPQRTELAESLPAPACAPLRSESPRAPPLS